MDRVKITAPAAAEPPAPSAEPGRGGSPLLTMDEAAVRLGVNPRTIRRWIKDRGLPAIKFTEKVIRIRPEDLEAFIAQHEDFT